MKTTLRHEGQSYETQRFSDRPLTMKSGQHAVENCRDIELILHVVLAWARAQPKIRAVALVGSYARGTARTDSDIDLVLLATDADRFRADTSWVTEIDWHATGARPQRWRDEEFGAAWSRRIWLEPHYGQVELTFAPLSWATTDPIDDGTRRVISEGCRILHDPDALLQRIYEAVSREIGHVDCHPY